MTQPSVGERRVLLAFGIPPARVQEVMADDECRPYIEWLVGSLRNTAYELNTIIDRAGKDAT